MTRIQEARRRAKESDVDVLGPKGRRTASSSSCVRANWFPAMYGVNRRRKRVAAHRSRVLCVGEAACVRLVYGARFITAAWKHASPCSSDGPLPDLPARENRVTDVEHARHPSPTRECVSIYLIRACDSRGTLIAALTSSFRTNLLFALMDF